jgi:hypothetical protein
MPDLKLDIETAVTALGKQLDYGIESLRRTAEALLGDIRTAAEVLDGPMKLNIADADSACVIDFSLNYGNARNIELRMNGSDGGHVELASPLPQGRYRAIILLNKIDEPAGR